MILEHFATAPPLGSEERQKQEAKGKRQNERG
jgi:hypothetical protein